MLAAATSAETDFVVCYCAAGVTPGEQEEFRLLHHLPAAGYSVDDARIAVEVLRRRIEAARRGVPSRVIYDNEEAVRREPWFELVGGYEHDDLLFDLAIYDYDPRPSLERVRCPVLGIWGEADIFVPVDRSVEAFEESSRAAGRAADEYVVLPALGHSLRDDTGAIAPAVLERPAFG